MHDIGKISIPDAILNKPGALSEEERGIMQTHAEVGYSLLKHSSRKLLKVAAIVAYEHHEKYDATGYPRKIGGSDISEYGKITSVADVFDALSSDRCYKKAWPLEKVIQLFEAERAKSFDPVLVDILLKEMPEFLKVKAEYQD
jgi:HD-GYP domain-containing protein (c-di-GMP phosphodiesterase class II)